MDFLSSSDILILAYEKTNVWLKKNMQDKKNGYMQWKCLLFK